MNKIGKAGAKFALRLWTEVVAHRQSLDILIPLLAVILMVDILTFAAGFGGNDDPGTYTSQAYAILHGHVAHYTYWYDHPPAGWIQIAGYMFLTDGFHRAGPDTLKAGEFMIVMQLVSCVLIFALLRRLSIKRGFAALAVALFALNPIAIEYQKMAFLDNMAVTWALAALVFAASPRRSYYTAIMAGLCLAAATLTKETAAFCVFPVVYLLWQNHGKGRRLWSQTLFLFTYLMTGGLYILYAIVKRELLPGDGHVSLWWALTWQFGRPAASNTLGMWLDFDRLLLYFTLAALPVAFLAKRLRPIIVGFVVLALIVLKGGYLPSPFVINILPFAAMVVAGALGTLWPHRAKVGEKMKLLRRITIPVRVVAVLAAIAVMFGLAAPKWRNAVEAQTPRGEVTYYTNTLHMIEANVPKDAVIAVDDNMWVDLKQAGYVNVVWFYKLDLDPAIAKKYVPPGIGYKGIDYVVLKKFYFTIAQQDGPESVVIQAQQHANLVAEFGNTQKELGQYVEPYEVYKVNKDNGGVSQ